MDGNSFPDEQDELCRVLAGAFVGVTGFLDGCVLMNRIV